MKYRYTLLIALLVHVILIFALTKISWSTNTTTGFSNAMIVQSYVFAPKSLAQQSAEKSAEDHSLKAAQNRVNNNKITFTNQVRHSRDCENPDSSNCSQTSNAEMTATASNLSHGQYNQLLIALHNAIGEQQVYPSNARMLDQQGTVQVGFTLLPNGNLASIKIIKSSGFSLLDQAALNAVVAISPFTKVKVLSQQQLQISIGFYVGDGF